MTGPRCICDHNPDTTDGPESDCPKHGWSDGPTASDIAASIDTTTVAGHHLRALLLRLADGEFHSLPNERMAATSAIGQAATMGLGQWPPPRDGLEISIQPPFALTPLGREVAERLRPETWLVDTCPTTGHRLIGRSEGFIASVFVPDEAERIAALLTADDLRAAKAYKVEP